MLNCQHITELVSEREDRELSRRERAMLKVHLMMCTGCRRFSRQIPLLRQIVRLSAEPGAPEAPQAPVSPPDP